MFWAFQSQLRKCLYEHLYKNVSFMLRESTRWTSSSLSFRDVRVLKAVPASFDLPCLSNRNDYQTHLIADA